MQYYGIIGNFKWVVAFYRYIYTRSTLILGFIKRVRHRDTELARWKQSRLWNLKKSEDHRKIENH